jgi:hypothetical protein
MLIFNENLKVRHPVRALPAQGGKEAVFVRCAGKGLNRQRGTTYTRTCIGHGHWQLPPIFRRSS